MFHELNFCSDGTSKKASSVNLNSTDYHKNQKRLFLDITDCNENLFRRY